MTKQKRLLMLGGAYSQVPSIKRAKELGHYVITCDYLPDNPGHQYADEYYNVSTTDKEAVLSLARDLHIDGIVAYASDPAAPTAAYVAEKLGLPGTSYESVMTLGRKDLFRAFLEKQGFLTPKSAGFTNLEDAREYFLSLGKPAMIKPADSSGSKGVRKVVDVADFEEAFFYALSFSRDGIVVVEEYIQRVGSQIMGDGFVVNGKLVFTAFIDHYHDDRCSPFVPIGGTIPSRQSSVIQQKAESEIQKILSLLHWESGALNIEYIVDSNGDVYLLEIGPRNGGNFVPDLISLATGVDLITYTIRAALGEDCSDLQAVETRGYHAYYVLHSSQGGILQNISFSPEFEECVRFYQPYLHPGDVVDVFNGANCALGIALLEFSSEEMMYDMMSSMDQYVSIDLQDSIRGGYFLMED